MAETALPSRKPGRATVASAIVALTAALLGGVFLPFGAPGIAADAARLCLLAGLRMTGHLDIGAMMIQVHLVCAVVSGLFALAAWEVYHTVRPRDRERAAFAALYIYQQPRPLATVIFGGVGLMLILGYTQFGPTPSDDPLIANLTRNRAAFDRLRQSLQTNPALHTVRIDNPDGSEPEGAPPAIPVSDSARFLSQLQEAGVTCVRPIGSQQFVFTAWTENSLHGTREKGYLYSAAPPAPVVPSLDSHQPDADESLFRRISGDWYLLSSRSPEPRR